MSQDDGAMTLPTLPPIIPPVLDRTGASPEAISPLLDSLGPLLTGAAAGAILNGRETRKLGQQIRNDLRRRALSGPEGP